MVLICSEGVLQKHTRKDYQNLNQKWTNLRISIACLVYQIWPKLCLIGLVKSLWTNISTKFGLVIAVRHHHQRKWIFNDLHFFLTSRSTSLKPLITSNGNIAFCVVVNIKHCYSIDIHRLKWLSFIHSNVTVWI